MIEYIDKIKELLAQSLDVKTIKLGIERTLSAKDCPAIRIILYETAKEQGWESLDIGVVILLDIKDNDLESLYKKTFELEEKIVKSLQNAGYFHTGTKFDADVVDRFKTTIVHFKLEGIYRDS